MWHLSVKQMDVNVKSMWCQPSYILPQSSVSLVKITTRWPGTDTGQVCGFFHVTDRNAMFVTNLIGNCHPVDALWNAVVLSYTY